MFEAAAPKINLLNSSEYLQHWVSSVLTSDRERSKVLGVTNFFDELLQSSPVEAHQAIARISPFYEDADEFLSFLQKGPT
jgi:hypothetical protein